MLTRCNSWVPRGTYPKLRSINGALGPTNDTLKAGDEADLDFQVAIPLIWPQKTVLFQTDDEWYQKNQLQADTKYPGFFNSELFSASSAPFNFLLILHQPSSMPSTNPTATSQPSTRPATA